MLQRPLTEAVDIHALVTLLREQGHIQTYARGRAKGIDDIDLAVGELRAEHIRRGVSALHGIRNTRRQTDMQDILALAEHLTKIVDILADGDLGGRGIGAVTDIAVELLGAHLLIQIIGIRSAVDHKMEADIADAELLEHLLGHIGSGTCTQNIAHSKHSFCFHPSRQRAIAARTNCFGHRLTRKDHNNLHFLFYTFEI